MPRGKRKAVDAGADVKKKPCPPRRKPPKSPKPKRPKRPKRPKWWFPSKVVLSVDIGVKNFAWWCGRVTAKEGEGVCDFETLDAGVRDLFPEGKKATDFTTRECNRFVFDFVTERFNAAYRDRHHVDAAFIEMQFMSNKRAEIIAYTLETNYWHIMPGVATTTVSSANKTNLIKRERPDLWPTDAAYKAMSSGKRKALRKKVSVTFGMSIHPELVNFVGGDPTKWDDPFDAFLQTLASTSKLRTIFPHDWPAPEAPVPPQ